MKSFKEIFDEIEKNGIKPIPSDGIVEEEFDDWIHTFICEYEENGYCNNTKRCKEKSRIYEEGPRGGMRKTKGYCCLDAL